MSVCGLSAVADQRAVKGRECEGIRAPVVKGAGRGIWPWRLPLPSEERGMSKDNRPDDRPFIFLFQQLAPSANVE
jgi:hypothetical protein